MSSRSYEIVGQRLLIRPDNPEKKTEWGFVLPGEWNEKDERRALDCGTVLQIGHLAWKDFKDDKPWCNVGDRVVFARHAGKFIQDPDNEKEDLLMIRDEDIQCVIRGE